MSVSSRVRAACLAVLAAIATAVPARAAEWPSGWSVRRDGASVVVSSPALPDGRQVAVVAEEAAPAPEPLRDWFEAKLAGTLAIGEVRGRSGFDAEGTLIKHSFELKTANDTWVKVHGFAYETPSGKQIFQVIAPADLADDDPLVAAALGSVADFRQGEMALVAGEDTPMPAAAAPRASEGGTCRMEKRTVTVMTMKMICRFDGCGMRPAPTQQRMQQQVCD